MNKMNKQKLVATVLVFLLLLGGVIFYSKTTGPQYASEPTLEDTEEYLVDSPAESVVIEPAVITVESPESKKSLTADEPKHEAVKPEKSDVVIKNIRAEQSGSGWDVHVTLEHPDSGWDHYSNIWRIVDSEGNVIATRVLAHPHENEQPFTRSLYSVPLPENHSKLYIEAEDTVHGLTAREEIVF